MELKWTMDDNAPADVFTFNRTAYGIEIVYPLYRLLLSAAFNRTAYGIEIVITFLYPCNMRAFNRTAYGIEIHFLQFFSSFNLHF